MRLSELRMHQCDLSVCVEPTLFQFMALMPTERKQHMPELFFLHLFLLYFYIYCHEMTMIFCVTKGREGQATKDLIPVEISDFSKGLQIFLL